MSGPVAPDRATNRAYTAQGMRRVRAGLIAAGVILMVYAVLGAVNDPTDRLGGHAAFLLAVLVGHDGFLMPLAIGVGVLVGRFVPKPAHGLVAGAMYVSGVLVFVALPLVLGFGAKPDEPSALPLNYGRGLVIMLGMVWVIAAATILYRRRRGAAADPAPASRTLRD